jgi:hypothetical protein
MDTRFPLFSNDQWAPGAFAKTRVEAKKVVLPASDAGGNPFILLSFVIAGRLDQARKLGPIDPWGEWPVVHVASR